MDYYEKMRRFSMWLDKEFNKIIAGQEIKIAILVYETSLRFGLSEKHVMKKIDTLMEINPYVRNLEGTLYLDNKKGDGINGK